MFYTNRISFIRKINCLDDCKQSGCPGHEIELKIHSVTGTATYSKDGKDIFWLDSIEAEALLSILQECESS